MSEDGDLRGDAVAGMVEEERRKFRFKMSNVRGSELKGLSRHFLHSSAHHSSSIIIYSTRSTYALNSSIRSCCIQNHDYCNRWMDLKQQYS